jgi:small subunit ribosomal protein S18
MPQENTSSSSSSGHSSSGGRSYSPRPGGGRPGGGGGRPGGRPGGPRPGGPRRRFPRRKVCRFCVDKVKYIDFKNYRTLRDFITERGKIMPRRITGTCAFHQRMLTTAIKRARNMALISFAHK